MERLIELCRALSPGPGVVAALSSPRGRGRGAPEERELLLVLERYEEKARLQPVKVGGIATRLLLVDREAFEGDVEDAVLGEMLAQSVLYPYQPLVNQPYLWRQEVRAKRRVVLEELESLVHQYRGLCHEILIEPRYFMHARIERSSKLLPSTGWFPGGAVGSQWGEEATGGYIAALEELAREGVVVREEGFFKVSRGFAERVGRRVYRAVVPLREVERAVRRYAAMGFMGGEAYNAVLRELLSGFEAEGPRPRVAEPKRFLRLRTALGLVEVGDELTLRDIVERGVVFGEVSRVEVERLGGTLNFVYLLRVVRGGEETAVVAKRFEDWCGLKWVPIWLWAAGTQGFHILGERRLANQYRMGRLLEAGGVAVPEIYYVNPGRKVLLESYVQGRSLEGVVKSALAGGGREELGLVRRLGREVARVHSRNVTIGDCKPENAILSLDQRIYFVDLEQAREGGNPAWDVAEMLYYSGHYTIREEEAEALAHAFLEGYLEDGDRERVREAGSARYLRIFSVFTAPHILRVMSRSCRALGAL